MILICTHKSPRPFLFENVDKKETHFQIRLQIVLQTLHYHQHFGKLVDPH